MVQDLDQIVTFGKARGSQYVPNDADGHAPFWKKKSIFWKLPYWKVLEVRSAIDVMHVTNNLCVKPARIYERVWKHKRYARSTAGLAKYERPRRSASNEDR